MYWGSKRETENTTNTWPSKRNTNGNRRPFWNSISRRCYSLRECAQNSYARSKRWPQRSLRRTQAQVQAQARASNPTQRNSHAEGRRETPSSEKQTKTLHQFRSPKQNSRWQRRRHMPYMPQKRREPFYTIAGLAPQPPRTRQLQTYLQDQHEAKPHHQNTCTTHQFQGQETLQPRPWTCLPLRLACYEHPKPSSRDNHQHSGANPTQSSGFNLQAQNPPLTTALSAAPHKSDSNPHGCATHH